MWEEIISIAINHGLMTALFVGLMVYVLKDGRKREKKYQDTIEKLAESLKIVHEIQETTKELKKDVNEIKIKI
ncbi:MAG: BhlA/UviB family holin-like peptide [Firmicutes bacterium]|nr:BhlA/UviB family holin-like peptide [Bacillota bacterium]